MNPSGLIFDVDGTIVDNMPFHQRAWDTFLGRHGLPPFSPEMRARNDGKNNRDILPAVFGRALNNAEIERFTEEKERLYRELSRGHLQPHRGFPALLDALAAREIPVALATSAPEKNVEHTLAELGLRERLRVVARSDEVPRGKPYPDVFLAAAERIHVPAAQCVAFEDAPMGVQAAKAAGMTCVALTTNFTLAVLRAHGAQPDHAVADFGEYLAGPGAWLRTGAP